MRIQKCYVGYCIALWALWLVAICAIALVGISRDFYPASISISIVTTWATLIPVHWVLGVCAMLSSLKKQTKYTNFNITSMAVNVFVGLFVLMLCISHVN
jgi:hypothetical protein